MISYLYFVPVNCTNVEIELNFDLYCKRYRNLLCLALLFIFDYEQYNMLKQIFQTIRLIKLQEDV